MFRYSLVLLAGLVAAGPSAAATWADNLFDESSCDFGSVPRGAVLTHPFRVTNTTGGPVTISAIRVSCGCTSAYARQSVLAPGQSTTILATMDSHRFQGERTVTVYVDFSQPEYQEARLSVRADSREDVQLTPEALAFGEVSKGTAPAAAATVSLIGTENWGITGVRSESYYVTASAQALPGNALEANYRVTARLRPDTPAGNWVTTVWLLTNNPAAPRVRVPVTVSVK